MTAASSTRTSDPSAAVRVRLPYLLRHNDRFRQGGPVLDEDKSVMDAQVEGFALNLDVDQVADPGEVKQALKQLEAKRNRPRISPQARFHHGC